MGCVYLSFLYLAMVTYSVSIELRRQTVSSPVASNLCLPNSEFQPMEGKNLAGSVDTPSLEVILQSTLGKFKAIWYIHAPFLLPLPISNDTV